MSGNVRKLDLGCGANKPEGYEGADIAPLPGVDHVFDLMQFPWPFEDGTFDELRSSHQIEHIPQAFYTPNPRYPIGKNITAVAEGPHSISLFLKFFAECWRVLKPGGTMRVHCPHGHSDRAFQDPTHVRYIVEASFDYLDHEWRKANGLQHAAYGAGGLALNFPGAQRRTGATGSPEQIRALALMADDVQSAMVARNWNMLSDFDVTLVKAPIPVADAGPVEAKQPEAVAAS